MSVVPQLGLHDVGENVPVTPDGKPETENAVDNDCPGPFVRL